MLIFALCFALTASDFDTKDLILDLRFNPTDKTISGFAELGFVRANPETDSLVLDLYAGLKVSRVTISDQVRPYKRVADQLFIGLGKRTPQQFRVRVEYAGTPREAPRPPWDGGVNWSRTDSGDPWIGVSCQGVGAGVWYPSRNQLGDKIEGYRLTFRVPDGLTAASNGLLVSRDDNVFVWEGSYPIAPYNISVNIAPFKEILRTFPPGPDRTTPLKASFYFIEEAQHADMTSGDDRSWPQKQEDLITHTKRYLDFMEEHYGPYPWPKEKLGVVHTNYLGMEHQTINSYGNRFQLRYDCDYILLHELAHEWFGNQISGAHWGEIWIHEGFGMFVNLHYYEHIGQEQAAQQTIANAWRAAPSERALVRAEGIKGQDSLASDIYNRGTLVLVGLRYLVGQEIFERGIKRFLKRRGAVTTRDFQKDMETASGRSLDWFFDVYAYQVEPPVLTSRATMGAVDFSWDNPKFNMPIEIALNSQGSSRLQRVEFDGGRARLNLPSGTTWELDPRRLIYRKLDEP